MGTVCSAGTQQQCKLDAHSNFKRNICCPDSQLCTETHFTSAHLLSLLHSLQARSSNASWVLGWQLQA
jgi:hypothetical protein